MHLTTGFYTVRIITALALLLFIQCHNRSSCEIHIDQPFYPLHQPSYARFFGHDMIRNRVEKSFVAQGVYTAPDTAYVDTPTLRLFDDKVGLKYVSLMAQLDAEDGDLVEVKGKVYQKEISIKETNFIQKKEILIPDEVRIIQKSSDLKKSVQNEYQNMKVMLQKKITPEGSRLVLQDTPRWYVVWSESDGSFIVSTRQTDLMYQAEIDFVFDGETYILKEVYAVEWFKGE